MSKKTFFYLGFWVVAQAKVDTMIDEQLIEQLDEGKLSAAGGLLSLRYMLARH